MKIAIYVQDMRASGVVRTMIAMAKTFQQTDQAVLVAGYASGIFGAAEVAPASFLAAVERPSGALPRLAVVPHLRQTLRKMRPDVILSGGNFGHFSLWAATRGLGIPLVYVFSNAMERAGQPLRNRWRRVWSGLLTRGSGGVILVGANLARSGVGRTHIESGKAVLIPNGIDLAAVPEPDGSIPKPITGPEPVILSIGRLQPQKNFEALIDAVAVVRRTRPVRLVVLGTGADAYRATLIARTAAHGLTDHVLFAGTTENVSPWLRAARVFALASYWEGSSIALLEAMAAGTPIVASRTAGNAVDVLDDGRYGLIADAEDSEAFAFALLRQIDDPIRPHDRARAYDAPAMIRAYHAMLTAVVAQADGPASAARA